MTAVAEGVRAKQPFVMLNLFQHNAASLVIPKQVRDDDLAGKFIDV